MNRNKINPQMDGLIAQSKDEKVKLTSPITRGIRRPCTSLCEPATNCPKARPSRQAVRLNWASDVLVCNSLVKIGRAGKYILIDKGPKADNKPNIIAVHNRRDCEAFEIETDYYSFDFLIRPRAY